MAKVSIPRGVLGYDDSGTGRVVVLVHAGLADRRMWDRQFAVLSRTHRTIRYDWRGYGGSSDLSAEVAHHEDLLALMNALEIESATLVGASMGGCYALDAALTQPGRVDGLVLVSAVFSGFAWPAESLAQTENSARAAVPPERLSRYAQRDLEPDPADVAAMAAANVALMVAGPGRSLDDLEPAVRDQALLMCADVFAREWSSPAFPERHLRPPAAGRLHEVSVPTLVINGLCDLGGVQAAADQLTEGIAGARRLDLERTGHLAPVERPAETSAAIDELLRSTGALGPVLDA
jgi:pimeloyl-ACP methyl ester carboxylesterase